MKKLIILILVFLTGCASIQIDNEIVTGVWINETSKNFRGYKFLEGGVGKYYRKEKKSEEVRSDNIEWAINGRQLTIKRVLEVETSDAGIVKIKAPEKCEILKGEANEVYLKINGLDFYKETKEI